MKLITPQRRWPIWLLSASVPLSYVATSFLYYPLLLKSGLLDQSADSIGMPLFQDLYLAVFSVPVISFMTWACLRDYKGEADLLVWEHQNTIRFWITTVFAGMFIAALIFDNITSLISVAWWCNLIWLPHSGLLAYWVLMLRAAVLSRTG